MVPPIRPTPPAPVAPGLGRTQARLVWSAIGVVGAAVIVGALVAGSAVPGVGAGALPGILLAVGCVVVVADLAVGFLVTSRIRKSAPPDAPPDAIAATQVIVGSATALSGLIVCAVFFFLTREGLLLLLAAPCAVVLLTWFPSERRWAALRPAPAPGAPRHTLMRE